MKAKVKYLILASMLFCSGLYAQTFSIGAEGEVTTTSTKISGIPNAAVQVSDGKNIMGYEIGPYLKLSLGSLYIKPKVLISYQSGTVQVIYPDHSANVSLAVTKMDIPLLIGLKILGPLSIEGGPVYSRILTATKDFDGNSITLEPNGMGYRIGANLQLGIIGLNVDYQGNKNNSSGSFSSFSTPNELIFGASVGF